MKTTYRLLVRRRVEASLRLRLKTPTDTRDIGSDDPADLPPELVDRATTEVARTRQKVHGR
jgi:hypothetical protein